MGEVRFLTTEKHLRDAYRLMQSRLLQWQNALSNMERERCWRGYLHARDKYHNLARLFISLRSKEELENVLSNIGLRTAFHPIPRTPA